MSNLWVSYNLVYCLGSKKAPPKVNCIRGIITLSKQPTATTCDEPWMSQQSAELLKYCTRASGKPCSMLFTEDQYANLKAQAFFLTNKQLDLVILGSNIATVSRDEYQLTYMRHKPAKRQKMVTTYMHHGHHLCKATYNFLHGVGNHQVKSVKQSYLVNGLSVRTHGNTTKHPHNALSYVQINNIIKFIQSYAKHVMT